MLHVTAIVRGCLRRAAPSWSGSAWRAFWVLMLVAHTPGWLAACGAGGGAGPHFDVWRWALLTASQLLFVLKVVDVRWLRLPRERRAWLTVAVAVALLHADVVRQYAGADGSRTAPVCATVAVAAAAALGLRRTHVRRLLETLHPRALHRRLRARLHLRLTDAERAWLPPRYLLLLRACRVNRAPPV